MTSVASAVVKVTRSRPYRTMRGALRIAFVAFLFVALVAVVCLNNWVDRWIPPKPIPETVASDAVPSADGSRVAQVFRREHAGSGWDDSPIYFEWVLRVTSADGDSREWRLSGWPAYRDLEGTRRVFVAIAWHDGDRLIYYKSSDGREGTIEP